MGTITIPSEAAPDSCTWTASGMSIINVQRSIMHPRYWNLLNMEYIFDCLNVFL